MQYFISIYHSACYALAVIAFWYISKIITDAITKANDDEQIEQKGNIAMALMRAGQYIGIAVGMAAVLSDGGSGIKQSFSKDMLMFVVDGALIVILFQVSRFLNNRFILPRICNDTEIEKCNMAVGIAECGLLLSTGLIMNGAFYGEGAILAGIIFFALGQAVFIIAARLMEHVKSYNVIEQIYEGNVAAGIILAGNVLSLGFIMRASVSGEFTGWGTDLLGFALSAVLGFVLLFVFQWVADLLFLPNTREKQQIVEFKNNAAALIIVSIQTGLSITVGAII